MVKNNSINSLVACTIVFLMENFRNTKYHDHLEIRNYNSMSIIKLLSYETNTDVIFDTDNIYAIIGTTDTRDNEKVYILNLYMTENDKRREIYLIFDSENHRKEMLETIISQQSTLH